MTAHSSNKTAAHRPRSASRSRWDRLPLEMKLHVMSFAGILTRFLCGLLRTSESLLDPAVCRRIWLDALECDWHGDLSLLPAGVVLSVDDLLAVRSRSMFARLCTADSCVEVTSVGQRSMSAWMALTNMYKVATRDAGKAGRPSVRLMHVPMRYCWLDLLDMAHPVALGWQAIAGGHLTLLRHLAYTANVIDLARYGTDADGRHAMDVAADAGHLGIVQTLHEAGCRASTAAGITGAAVHGHLDTLAWLHAHRADQCMPWAVAMAAKHGHLHVVKWMREHCADGWSTDVMDKAAEAGELEIVQWLHEHRAEGCTVAAMDHAARYGHLATVQWLHAHRREGCSRVAMNGAAQNGHLHVVQWLHEHRREGCTTSAMDEAARAGHLDVVRFLHEHRREGCTAGAMNWAAFHGHLDVVQWLQAHRSEAAAHTAMAWAAEGGHDRIAQFLHGCLASRSCVGVAAL